MSRKRWSVALLLAGGVLLLSALVTSMSGVSVDGKGCGSVIAPVHNSSAQIDRVCEPALSDRSSTAWVLGVGGLVAVGAGVVLRLRAIPTL